jgi:hypothetical protein
MIETIWFLNPRKFQQQLNSKNQKNDKKNWIIHSCTFQETIPPISTLYNCLSSPIINKFQNNYISLITDKNSIIILDIMKNLGKIIYIYIII